jgi:hypothetical protein
MFVRENSEVSFSTISSWSPEREFELNTETKQQLTDHSGNEPTADWSPDDS